MYWDKPASTLTMNSGVISSDLKGHPEQNRVLSLREILLLSTLDHPQWKKTYSFEEVSFEKIVSRVGDTSTATILHEQFHFVYFCSGL